MPECPALTELPTAGRDLSTQASKNTKNSGRLWLRLLACAFSQPDDGKLLRVASTSLINSKIFRLVVGESLGQASLQSHAARSYCFPGFTERRGLERTRLPCSKGAVPINPQPCASCSFRFPHGVPVSVSASSPSACFFPPLPHLLILRVSKSTSPLSFHES